MADSSQRLPWQSIVAKYPQEYIALIDTEETPTHIVSGIVVAHDPNRQRFHEKTKQLGPQHTELSISYTGKLVEDTTTPLLWQITPTPPSTA